MPHNRFFSVEPLAVGDLILGEEEAHHLVQVMRTRLGETVEVADGRGNLATGRLVEIGKKQARLALDTVVMEAKPNSSLTLVLALLRPAHMEYALEKCTEVGVTDFILFAGERSERKEISPTSLHRYQSIIQAALKQSGRLYLPTLTFTSNLQQAIQNQPFIAFGDLSSTAISIKKATIPQTACVVIGPESGFSEKEVDLLHKLSAVGIRFHSNTLRAETAAVVASYALILKTLIPS